MNSFIKSIIEECILFSFPKVRTSLILVHVTIWANNRIISLKIAVKSTPKKSVQASLTLEDISVILTARTHRFSFCLTERMC